VRKRVFIVDASPLCRAGLVQLLRTDRSLAVSGQAGSVSDALGLLDSDEPDLIVLGLVGEGADALDQFLSLRIGQPARRIVLLVPNVSSRWMRRALVEGAAGYLDKQCSLSQLREKIKAALRDQAAVCDPLRIRGTDAPAIHRSIAPAPPPMQDVALLTGREREVLHQIARGLSNRGIAHALGIAEGTVKVHVKNVLKKLGISSRVNAAVWAASFRHANPAGQNDLQVLRRSDSRKLKPGQHPTKTSKHEKRGKEPSTRQPGLHAARVGQKRTGARRQASGHK
jgi:two-component system nitrate/nitrite response regulator NarL